MLCIKKSAYLFIDKTLEAPISDLYGYQHQADCSNNKATGSSRLLKQQIGPETENFRRKAYGETNS
jgi:hypothetical protein